MARATFFGTGYSPAESRPPVRENFGTGFPLPGSRPPVKFFSWHGRLPLSGSRPPVQPSPRHGHPLRRLYSAAMGPSPTECTLGIEWNACRSAHAPSSRRRPGSTTSTSAAHVDRVDDGATSCKSFQAGRSRSVPHHHITKSLPWIPAFAGMTLEVSPMPNAL